MRDAIKDARKIIESYYPNCQGAIVAGSVIRGGGTETSDLDIVIYDSSFENGFRESIIAEGWPVEFFCHNNESFDYYFNQDLSEGTPSLQKMVTEGVVIKDHPFLHEIIEKGQAQLDEGPKAYSDMNIQMGRYFITDTLDDLIGSKNDRETICIVNKLYEKLHVFHLGVNRQWIGHGKWMNRAMMNFDPDMAERLYLAFDDFYKKNSIDGIINVTDLILSPYGGRLFEGFSIGKK